MSCDHNLEKVWQWLTSVTADAEMPSWPNALSKTAEDFLISGILPQKLFKSHGGCCFWSLIECAEDSFYAIYLVNLPTNESHKVLNQENRGQRPRLIRGHVCCLALLSNGSVNLAVDGNRVALWIIGFVAGKFISVVQWCNSKPRLR
jgi:hypothetical protein